MESKIVITFLLLSLSLIVACETIFHAQGTVVSSVSETPIDNVVVRLKLVDSGTVMDSVFTDQNGYFNVVSGVVGCVPRCPKTVIEFIGTDYIELTLEYETIDPFSLDSLRIKLEPKTQK